MDCPEPVVLEAVARGELDPWPSGLEQHLDGCAACMQRLIEAGARHPATLADADETYDDAPRDLPTMAAGRYEFVGELGRGGQSRVLRAYDRLLRHDVAFKQFVPRSSEPRAESIARARFVREIGIMADLAHPGVIPILDLGLRDGWPYCTMHVVEGETLTEARLRVADDPAGIDRLLAHFVAVCETVDFAHGLNIVHRDLKPDNVMLGAFGQTYVLDWALAKRLQDADHSRSIAGDGSRDFEPWTTEIGAAVGTPAYMSPEHLDARVGADPSSDIWSLGAVLFFVATGRAPFDATAVGDLLASVQRAHRDGLPSQLLAGVPRELAAIIRHAMSPARGERYADAGAIARDVEAYRTDRSVGVVEYTSWQRLARSVRHHPTLVIAAGVVMIVAAVGFVVTWSALQRESRAHEQTAEALDGATAAREESERLFVEERRRAAEVTAALSGAHAERAVQLRADKYVLSARAEAALGLLALEGLDETLLDASLRHRLEWVRARLRGEILSAERDIVSGYERVRLRSDGRLRNVVRGGETYSEWTDDDVMIVRRISDGQEVASLRPDGLSVTAIALSPSGTQGATVVRDAEGTATIVSWAVDQSRRAQWKVPVKRDGVLAVADDGTVAANDPTDDVFVLRPGAERPHVLMRLPNWALALSADGARVAISGNEGELRVVDTERGAAVLGCDDHPDRLTAVTFSADGGAVLAGCVSGHVVVCSDDAQVSVTAHSSRITAVALSGDGRLAFTGGLDNRLVTTDVSGGKILARVDVPRENVYNLAYDPERDELHAFAGSGMHTWALRTDAMYPVRPTPHMVKRHFDFDDRTFLVPHGLEPLVVEVDAQDGTSRTLDLPQAGPPAYVRRHHDHIYTIDFSGVVSRFEEGAGGLRLAQIWDGEGRNFNTADLFGDMLAIEHKSPYGATLWDLSTGRKIRDFEGHEQAVFSIAFSPDGSRLATADSAGRIFVWEVASGRRAGELRAAGAAILGLAFEPAGGLVAASADGLSFWPRAEPGPPTALDHAHAYRFVAIDRVHRRVASARVDEEYVGLWNLESLRQELEVSAGMGVQDLALSSDGESLYWLSSSRMQRLDLPSPDELPAVDRRAAAALHAARSERVVLLRSPR
jgi:eukaryotic-like serine/threonine-protein kinase